MSSGFFKALGGIWCADKGVDEMKNIQVDIGLIDDSDYPTLEEWTNAVWEKTSSALGMTLSEFACLEGLEFITYPGYPIPYFATCIFSGGDAEKIEPEEDDHEGMIYNEYTKTWSWL